MIEALRLSWAAEETANPCVNFGDALRPIIVGYMAECDVRHAHFDNDGKSVAVGSSSSGLLMAEGATASKIWS